MEQKRILWIIAAVGVFLLVVLGAALILYSPASQENRTLARASDGNAAADGWVSLSPESEQGGIGMPNNVGNSITGGFENGGGADEGSGDMRMNHLPDGAGNTDDSGSAAQVAMQPEEPETTSIDLTAYDDGRAGGTVHEDAQKTVARAAVAEENAPPVKAAAPVQPAKKAPAPVKAAAKPSPAATVTAAPKKPTAPAPLKAQYWVQVTSLSNKKSADAAREILEENKITADVFTYENNKKQLFYRVRVGPYTTKSEAEYWRSKIAKIETFAASESYVTSTN